MADRREYYKEYNKKHPRGGSGNNGDYFQRRKRQRIEESTRYIDVELDFTPKKGQKHIIELAHNNQNKKIVINIFRQYGKSFVCRYLVLEWMQQPDTVVGYITQTSRLAKDIFKKFVQMFPEELIKSKDGKDFIIELVNGSKLIFFSVEQTHTIRGFTLDYLIWDEVSHSREYTPDGEHIYYNIVAPLLDAKGKKEIYISTPNGAQGFFYNEAVKGMNGEKGYAYYKVSVYDDETKDNEWIEYKKKGYPELSWKQEYECEFLESGISYFRNFGKLFKDTDFDWTQKLVCGVDFSSVGEDNTVMTFMNEKKQTFQYVIQGDLDFKYHQMAEHLKKMSSKLVYCLFESNSIGEVMGNEVKKLLPVGMRNKVDFIYTSNSTKQDYIEKLALDIENENISFMKDNLLLNEEFKTYTYTISKTGKKVFNALDGYHDDTVISCALANLAYDRKMTKSGSKIMVIRR